MATVPITIVVRHPKENPKKCSILPLRGRPDLRFFTYPVSNPPDFTDYIRLAAEGPALSADDRAKGILLIDASWRRAADMNQDFEQVPARSLSGYVTAYPRVSRLGTDPAVGLASIEALFLAYHILGRPTRGLLDTYHWKDRFLELNRLTETDGPRTMRSLGIDRWPFEDRLALLQELWTSVSEPLIIFPSVEQATPTPVVERPRGDAAE